MSTPTLPHTWRPRRTRMVCYGIATLVLVTLAVIAVILPDEGPTAFGVADRIGVFAVSVPIAWFLHRHARVRVTAVEEGLEVVNLFKRHRLLWGEVLAVRLRRGDPWAYLDLSDGETIAAMGIQASDGAAAPLAARELARLVHRRTVDPETPG